MWTLMLYQRALTLSYCCSVAKSCPTPCDPMGCSPPGFPVLHHLPEFAETDIHWVGDFSVTWGYFSLFCTLLVSLPTHDFMTWWFPELRRSSECGHTALYTRRSRSSVSFLISLEKSLLGSHHAPGGGCLCLKFLFSPGSANCILGNKCCHCLPGRDEVCSFLRKCWSHSQVWIIVVRLSFLLRCCTKTVALCKSRLRRLSRVLPASSHSILKRFPPGPRSNNSSDLYCFIKGALKWK